MAVRRLDRLVVDDVLLPRLARGAGVLVPDDLIAARDGGEQVGLAVAAEVARPDRARLTGQFLVDGEAVPDLVLGELAGIAEPGELLADPGRGRHVELAVAVEIDETDVIGP